MKRILLILPFLLACMTTVEPYQTYPAETPTVEKSAPRTATPKQDQSQEPDSGEVFIQIVPRCATVTADEALHIRAEPGEKSKVLGYLHNGEQVIIMQSTGAWWKIRTATVDGWSKAEFLQESECT